MWEEPHTMCSPSVSCCTAMFDLVCAYDWGSSVVSVFITLKFSGSSSAATPSLCCLSLVHAPLLSGTPFFLHSPFTAALLLNILTTRLFFFNLCACVHNAMSVERDPLDMFMCRADLVRRRRKGGFFSWGVLKSKEVQYLQIWSESLVWIKSYFLSHTTRAHPFSVPCTAIAVSMDVTQWAALFAPSIVTALHFIPSLITFRLSPHSLVDICLPPSAPFVLSSSASAPFFIYSPIESSF